MRNVRTMFNNYIEPQMYVNMNDDVRSELKERICHQFI